MATSPRRSSHAARLQRVARRRTRATPRRAPAPIGSRLPGRRRRTPALASPAAGQPSVIAPADRWTRIQQAVGTLAALGTLAVIVFTWLSLQQVDNEHALTREGQVTDRYNAAVGNIGEKSLEVRLGGIYALQRIMEDSPRDQPAIVNVLSTYIRSHAKKPKIPADASNQEPASDVQAALTALGHRDRTHDGTAKVDLTGANLTGANLNGAELNGAYLNGANLTDATLTNAELNGADLTYADLTYAYLNDAELNDANLQDANLTNATLTNAELNDADLRDAELPGANLTGADMTDADMEDANLKDANLTDANPNDAKWPPLR